MKRKGNGILPPAPTEEGSAISLIPEKKQPIEHWKEIVELWFTFCQEKFKEDPTFDGVSAKSLKLLMIAIKQRAIDQQVIWSASEACTRLRGFLLKAYHDKWMRDNFLLKNLNSQKDKFFFQKDNQNGTHQQVPNNNLIGTSNARIQAAKNLR